MLFNEPKLLKFNVYGASVRRRRGFSALQRAEIAESSGLGFDDAVEIGFSALQRAEIAEIRLIWTYSRGRWRFQCSSTSRYC